MVFSAHDSIRTEWFEIIGCDEKYKIGGPYKIMGRFLCMTSDGVIFFQRPKDYFLASLKCQNPDEITAIASVESSGLDLKEHQGYALYTYPTKTKSHLMFSLYGGRSGTLDISFLDLTEKKWSEKQTLPSGEATNPVFVYSKSK